MRALLASSLALTLAACGERPEDNASAGSETAAAAKAALQLDAQGIPKFRIGAWEVKSTTDGETETKRECIGEESNAQIREMLTRSFPKDCKVDRKSDSNEVRISASCPQSGLQVDSDVSITGSDTEFAIKIGTYVTKPGGERDGSDTTATGHWVGQCPAGAKPGEEIDAAE